MNRSTSEARTMSAKPKRVKPAPLPRSIRSEKVLNTRLERERDLVERRYRSGRLRAFDLGEERHAEARSPGHLLEREIFLLAQVADRVADDFVQLLFGCSSKALLAHDPRQHLTKLVDVERFLDVVDRVELHRCNRRLEVWIAREDHDREIGVDLANAFEHLDAIEVRHHEVQNEKVVPPLTNFGFDLRWIAERFDLVSVAFEQRLHIVTDGSIVVDDEDANCGKLDCHGCPPVWAEVELGERPRLNYSRTITHSAEGARSSGFFSRGAERPA